MSNSEYPKGKIHKLCVQDYNKTYYTVKTYNSELQATVVEIIEDKNYFLETGIKLYIIIVEDINTKGRYVGHEVENIPCIKNYAKPDKDGTMHNIS
jgi:hypothetical protein